MTSAPQTNRRVVILQEYIPNYRVSLFEKMREIGKGKGLDIVVATGSANMAQASRGDSSTFQGHVIFPQKEYSFLGRRLTVRWPWGALWGADAAVLEHARRNLDAYPLLLIKGSLQVALWGHGRDYVKSAGKVEQALMRLLTTRADWYFAYTQGGADAVARAGYDDRKVTVLNNTIDSFDFRQHLDNILPEELSNFRASLDLGENHALFMGALDESKRLHFLRTALDRVRDRDQSFELLIAGDGPERSFVEDWVSETSYVHYMGAAAGAQKALAFKSSNIILNPGRVGLLAVDSFVSGRPIITTDWPLHAPEFDYLIDGKNAIISDDNVESFAAHVLSARKDREQLANLTQECLQSASAYSVENMARNFVAGLVVMMES